MTAKIKLNAASGGGSVSIQAPSSSSNNRVITLPDIADGTLLTNQSSGLGKILQVVETVNSSYASVDTTKNQYVGSLSVNVDITPSATSSKIYLVYNIVMSAEVDARELTLTPTKTVSGTTSVLSRIGNASGSRTRVGVSQMSTSKHSACTHMMTFLDAPSTTSQITYGFYYTIQHGGGWVIRNSSFTNSNNSDYSVYASTVTAMEVAGEWICKQ